MTSKTKETKIAPVDVIRYLQQLLDNNTNWNLYMIVDAAQDQSIYPLLSRSGVPMKCLFQKGIHYPGETMTEMLKAAAPYLVTLDRGSPMLSELINNGWGKNWCTCIFTESEFDEVIEHCSGNLLARTEDGTTMQFRYFDPRILRVYLSSSTTEELSDFFGPVSAFCCEDESTAEPILFTLNNDDLIANYSSGVPWVPPDDPFE